MLKIFKNIQRTALLPDRPCLLCLFVVEKEPERSRRRPDCRTGSRSKDRPLEELAETRSEKGFYQRLKKSLVQRQFLWKGGSPLRKDDRREPANQRLVNQPTCRMSANFFLMTLWLVKIWQHGLASCRVVKETKTPFSFRGISSLSLS